jgi:starch synthase
VWIREMLPRPELVQLLNHATVFVCPSIYEPLGIVNLEAMACGTAVVASDVGGIPEVVADGETGLLAPVGDVATMASHVVALLGDSARRQRFARAARHRAETVFPLESTVARYLSVYRRLLGQQA